MNQMAKGLGSKDSELRTDALKQLERIKCFLWHGNVFKALQSIGNLNMDLDGSSLDEKQLKLLKTPLRISNLHRKQRLFYPQLWRALAVRGNDLHSVCGINGESSYQQTHG